LTVRVNRFELLGEKARTVSSGLNRLIQRDRGIQKIQTDLDGLGRKPPSAALSLLSPRKL
jgi:hypothetical protein